MADILDTILAAKAEEVAQARARTPESELRSAVANGAGHGRLPFMRRLNAASLGEADEPAADLLPSRKNNVYRRLRGSARP